MQDWHFKQANSENIQATNSLNAAKKAEKAGNDSKKDVHLFEANQHAAKRMDHVDFGNYHGQMKETGDRREAEQIGHISKLLYLSVEVIVMYFHIAPVAPRRSHTQ
jgi:hypothetical protein